MKLSNKHSEGKFVHDGDYLSLDKRSVSPTIAQSSAREGLACIELGHLVGALSYKPFQWYEDPVNCDSTVPNNIDAIYRHLTSFELGYPFDADSKLPHVVHIACRFAMLINIAYQPINHKSVEIKYPRNIKHHQFGDLLTAIELSGFASGYTIAKEKKFEALTLPVVLRELHVVLPEILDFCIALGTSECDAPDAEAFQKFTETVDYGFFLAVYLANAYVNANPESMNAVCAAYSDKKYKHIYDYVSVNFLGVTP